MFGKKKEKETIYDTEILEALTQLRSLRAKLVAITEQVITSKGVIDLFPEGGREWNDANYHLMWTKKNLVKTMEGYEATREIYNTKIRSNRDERICTKNCVCNKEDAQTIMRWTYRNFYKK